MDLPTAAPPPPATADQPAPRINVDFARDLLAATFETVRMPANQDPAHLAIRESATYTALTSLHARDPIELMLAAHVVASHHATMECFRRAMRAGDNADVAARLHRSAAMLSRMMVDAVNGLEARQQPKSGGKTP
jgi:hypothetical protein